MDQKKISGYVLAVATIIGIVSCFLTGLVVTETATVTRAEGVWYSNMEITFAGTTGEASGTETCSVRFNDQATETDCGSARKAKCQTTQAFSIIAVLFNLIAAVSVQMNMGPPIVGAGCAAFASLGYLIIWAIAAGIVNAESYDATDDSANCGVKLDGTDAGYGAAFALYIVAWLFTLGSAVMLMLNGNAGEVAPN